MMDFHPTAPQLRFGKLWRFLYWKHKITWRFYFSITKAVVILLAGWRTPAMHRNTPGGKIIQVTCLFFIYSPACGCILWFILYFLSPTSGFLYGKSHDQIPPTGSRYKQDNSRWYPSQRIPGLNALHRSSFHRRCVDIKFVAHGYQRLPPAILAAVHFSEFNPVSKYLVPLIFYCFFAFFSSLVVYFI